VSLVVRTVTGRHYKIDGERYPSVTTVLGMLEKSGLAVWRGTVGNAEADRISKEATDHGTAIHALVEQINRGQRVQLGPLERAIVAPYVKWFDESVGTVLGAEKLLISRRFKFAGTADAIVILRLDRAPTIVDFKSSKTDLAQREWALQTAAYALAAEEEGIEVGRRIIVRIPKHEPDKLYLTEFPEDELIDDQRAFLAVLRVFQWHEKRGPVKRPLGPRIRFGDQ
jgi:hypothetical protein